MIWASLSLWGLARATAARHSTISCKQRQMTVFNESHLHIYVALYSKAQRTTARDFICLRKTRCLWSLYQMEKGCQVVKDGEARVWCWRWWRSGLVMKIVKVGSGGEGGEGWVWWWRMVNLGSGGEGGEGRVWWWSSDLVVMLRSGNEVHAGSLVWARFHRVLGFHHMITACVWDGCWHLRASSWSDVGLPMCVPSWRGGRVL